ncbi:MAG TPA: nucleoside deaminase [Chitinophagales bacterium]|nr:nucleoside deaminase [Chitinophagales bacterium]HMW13071.1 nucleoside deaminase [Chitinophagales bacterium]HMX60218.1 nucleoside deaminase [Chitinophagales bacterium]HMY22533.1 nucleoside deaminase [Chitinophagales bacterium]HMZ34332.1 nucleoside deaminase [Chitinophagales bacterium]
METNMFMKRAIELSKMALQTGKGGPFGCVIVKDGKIVGEGHNQVTSTNDPTAHAEVVAIRNACKNLNSFQLEGCEVYTSCEPCPMCLGAIYWARPSKVYFANTREDAKQIGFDDSFIYDEIPLSISQRKIPMLSMNRNQALLVFEEWKNKSDKTEY